MVGGRNRILQNVIVVICGCLVHQGERGEKKIKI